MEILFVLLVIFHGFFHLLAFMKSFNLMAWKSLNVEITRPNGMVFLLAFVFFAFLVLMFAYKSTNWWIYGILGALISQVLIIKYWREAKFGTILNIAILWVCILAFAEHYFTKGQ